jgi:TRAP-type C4-dicarboxylate transport system permease small subunit
MAWSAYSESWTSPTMLSAPYAYIYVSMVFGSLMLLITFILRALMIFTGPDPEKQKE